ncbi:MAG: hypothetical protein U9Q07_14465 [Planctomycetota bacterium]|nr:hypothetical protein [Planctomycetota bacterium]
MSFEQISTWFMETLRPFVQEHAIVLSAILAALLVLFLILKLFRSKPGIADFQVRVDPCDLPPCRFFTGNIVATNRGRKRCNLVNVQLLHESLKFEISDITDRREKELTAPDRGIVGIQLPVSIKAKEEKKIFFFGYHRLATLEELPETLSLKITFNGRKRTYLYSLARALETTYCLYPSKQNPPGCRT